MVQAIQTNEEYGFAFPKGSKLTASFNKEIAKLRSDGGLKAISDKWFHGRPCTLHG